MPEPNLTSATPLLPTPSRLDDGARLLIPLKEVSHIVGLKRTQLRAYIDRGDLKAQRFGPMWGVTPENLAAFQAIPRFMGPKSKLRDPATLDYLEQLLEDGVSINAAMKIIGLSQDRYYRQGQHYPEFKQRMDAAHQRGLAKVAKRLQAATIPIGSNL